MNVLSKRLLPIVAYSLLMMVPLLTMEVDASEIKPQQYKTIMDLFSSKNYTELKRQLTFVADEQIYEFASLASENHNTDILYGYIGEEQISRFRKDHNITLALDQINSKRQNSVYREWIFWMINSSYNTLTNSELEVLFNFGLSHVLNSHDISNSEKLILVVLNTSILEILNSKQYPDNNKTEQFSTFLRSIIMNPREDSHVRRAGIKGVQQLGYKKFSEALLSLLLDIKVVNNPIVVRPVCLTLAEFRVQEAVPIIGAIISDTENEYVFASGMMALSIYNSKDALKLIIDNEAKFNHKYTGIAIRRMDHTIHNILASGSVNDLPYAIKSVKYFRSDFEINDKDDKFSEVCYDSQQLQSSLLHLLSKNLPESVIALIMKEVVGFADKDQIQQVIDKFNSDARFENEIGVMIKKNSSLTIQSYPSHLYQREEENLRGNITHQEYGDPAYRDLALMGLEGLGHAGLFAGINYANELRIVEVIGEIIGASSYVVQDRSWLGMAGEGTGYWGANTLNNLDMTFPRRQNVMNTAFSMIAYDIGYPFLAHDLLNHYSNPGEYVDINEIEELRCDGLVEYCYEWNDYEVWGRNGSNYDVSIVANVAEHNNLYGGIPPNNPDIELAPVVQSGMAGGTSTYMNWSASVDDPSHTVSIDQTCNEFSIWINAEDRSGIHYIKYKIGSSDSWHSSDIQPQNPISDNYTLYFTTVVEQSTDTVFFYSKDNGGNFTSVYYFPLIPASPLESPDDLTVSNDECDQITLEWNTVPGATTYKVYRDGSLVADVSNSPYVNYISGNHSYYIIAENSCGVSGSSNAEDGVSLAIPGIPNLNPPTSECDQVCISWGTIFGATNYIIYRDGTQLTNVDDSPYCDITSGSHTYTVAAENSCGISGISEAVQATPGTPPSAPSNLVASENGCDQITISWNTVASVSNYRVYKNGSFLAIDDASPYIDNTSGTHNYYVQAENACGTSGNSSSNDGTALSTPSAPGNLSTSNNICNQIILNWDQVADASIYKIYRDGNFLATYSETEYVDEGISGSHSYYVKAENDCGISGNSIEVNGIGLSPIEISGITATVDGVGYDYTFSAEVSWESEVDVVYDWDFGDGSAHSSQSGPAHTYSGDASLTVTLTMSYLDASNDNCTASVSLDMNVVSIDIVEIPEDYNLNAAYPNPFNPSTTITYGIPENSSVSLKIYDSSGRVVRTLVNEPKSAGWYSLQWNGTNANGNQVSTGLYFAGLQAGRYSKVIKVLYLK